MKRLLIVEDDCNLEEGLQFAFKNEYDTRVTAYGKKALAMLKEKVLMQLFWTAICQMVMAMISARK